MAKSRVTCTSFNIGSSATITINRDKSSYKHTLTYSFNGATGTIAIKTDSVSVGWTPSASTFYARIPNATSGYGTVICETFDGNTSLGTTTAGFYAYAVKNNCLPTVSGTVVDTNASTIAITGDSNIIVRYLSKPKVTVSATAKNSATISKKTIYMLDGQSSDTSPYTFNTNYEDRVDVKGIDSRGYSTTVRIDLGELDRYVYYDLLHFSSYSVKRTESTSTTAEVIISGYCYKGTIGATTNTLTLKYKYKATGGSYNAYTTITPTWNNDGTFTHTFNVSGLTLGTQYEFQFNIVDKLMNITTDEGIIILSTGMGDLRIGPNYVQSKNTFIVGTDNETTFKSFKAKRKVNNIPHFSEYGVSDIDNMAGLVLQLYKTVSGTNTQLARYDIRQDGFMYNYNTNMSVAEVMSSAPTMATSGNQGSMLINGGDAATPILLQWGRVNQVPAGANVVTNVNINFLKEYTSIPDVFTGSVHNLGVTLEVASNIINTSGFTLCLKRANTGNTGMFWMAIGNGTASLPA